MDGYVNQFQITVVYLLRKGCKWPDIRAWNTCWCFQPPLPSSLCLVCLVQYSPLARDWQKGEWKFAIHQFENWGEKNLQDGLYKETTDVYTMPSTGNFCSGLNLIHFHQDLLKEMYLAPGCANVFHPYSNLELTETEVLQLAYLAFSQSHFHFHWKSFLGSQFPMCIKMWCCEFWIQCVLIFLQKTHNY